MSRSYKGIRAKKNRVYSGSDLQNTYSVSANTVSNWVVAGLKPSNRSKPYVFRGADVTAFHKARRERTAVTLNPGEFKCRGCNNAVFADIATLLERVALNGVHMLIGRCSECEASVTKFSSKADRAFIERQRNPNTAVDSLHERNNVGPGGIGSSTETDCEIVHRENDRIIYKWQIHAGCYSEKTIDQHLASIRHLENLTNGKAFSQFSINDISFVREALKESLHARNDNARSKSTVAHIASHLMSFLAWLLKQDGFKRLPQDLPSYLKMPKSVYAAALPRKQKEYPTLQEAEGLLLEMPSRSLMDLRARAIFAIAFLGALRADTLVSLRIDHFDSENKQIIQDATLVRSKNGKSLNINWFPLPESFAAAVSDWLLALESEGFGGRDALFPSSASLVSKKTSSVPSHNPVPPMSTIHAVTDAFARACQNSNVKYTPHSAKHTIASERDIRPLTQLQRKAWSENMGHENEQITEMYYGKLSDDRRAEVFEELIENKPAISEAITDEAKVAFFDRFIEEFVKN